MARRSKQSYSVGPGAASLLLIVVVLCLTVLGILSLISARADHRLSVRNREMVLSYYHADAQTQHALSQLDGVLKSARAASDDDESYLAAVARGLPDGFALNGRMASYIADAGADRALTMTVAVLGFDDAERYRVVAVSLSDETVWEDQFIEDLFLAEDLM